MHHGQHDEFVRQGAKIDRVREALHERPAYFAMDTRISEGVLQDARDSFVDGCREGLSKP